MNKTIAILNGDGIGPEVNAQAVKVLNSIAQKYNHEFTYTHGLIGAAAIDATGLALPQNTIDTCLYADAVLFGAVGDPKYDNDPNAKVRPEHGILGIRKALQLYANIRPVNTYDALQHLSPVKAEISNGTDIVILRELTGGIYFGKKELSDDGQTATDICTYTTFEIERIAKIAFEYAMQRRKKVTLVDKANVLETSRLWRKTVQAFSANYPEVTVDYMFVDNAAMQLIINPKQFDVILTENLFGDVLSDEASVLAGSLGMLPSASIGNKTGLFEPIHGSYPQAAGKDIANPTGAILSAAMLLDYLQLFEEANDVRAAVEWAIQNKFVSKDIDNINFYFTNTIGDLIAEHILGNTESDINIENIVLRKSTVI